MSESKQFRFRAAKIIQEWDKTRPNQEKKCKKIIFCTSKCRFLHFFDRVRDWNGTESVRSADTPAKPDGVVSE